MSYPANNDDSLWGWTRRYASTSTSTQADYNDGLGFVACWGKRDGRDWSYSLVFECGSMTNINMDRYRAAQERFRQLGLSVEGIVFISIPSQSDWSKHERYEIAEQATIKVDRTSGDIQQLSEEEMEALKWHIFYWRYPTE